MHFDQIEMIEDKLLEIGDSLSQALREAAELRKNKLEPSPGLKEQIAHLRKRQETFLESLETWKTVLREYPNYDR